MSDTSIDTHSVLIDTGANCSIAISEQDFEEPIAWFTDKRPVSGIGKTLAALGQGRVAWTIMGDNGEPRTIRTSAYYIPSVGQQILATSDALSEHRGEKITISKNCLMFTGAKGVPSLTIPMCSVSKLPIAHISLPSDTKKDSA